MSAEYDVFHLRSSAGLYGAEYVILGLLPALADNGINGALLCLDNPYLGTQPLPAKADELGIACARLPCRGRFDFATIHALRRVLDAHPQALLHVHDYKSALVAYLARARRRTPIVATSHGQFSSTARLHLYHRLELSLMRRFDAVCIVSAPMRALLLRAGVNDAHIRLIENGIDTQRFASGVPPLPRAEFGIADDAIVFGSAIRLTEQKNPLGLVEAFARIAREVPRAVLAIAGDGTMRGAVRARAMELGVAARVHLLGARDDLERFYTMLDVFVLPSLYEGLPLALLEAMASGRTIVATRVGQVESVLTGLRYAAAAPGGVDSLARAMRDALSMPRGAHALRERVIARYSLQRMAKAYASVYADVRRRHAQRIAA